jgi:hypothetical protein
VYTVAFGSPFAMSSLPLLSAWEAVATKKWRRQWQFFRSREKRTIGRALLKFGIYSMRS